jgi:hypothetical protein
MIVLIQLTILILLPSSHVYGCATTLLPGQTAPPRRIHVAALRKLGVSKEPLLQYPSQAKKEKAQGVAAVDICFDSTGHVAVVSVLSAPHVSIKQSLERVLSDLMVVNVPPKWGSRTQVVRWVFYYLNTNGAYLVVDTSRPPSPIEASALKSAYQAP